MFTGKNRRDDRLLERTRASAMTKNPCAISPDLTLHEALALIRRRGFDNLPVIDGKRKPVGILDERDLLAEGIL